MILTGPEIRKQVASGGITVDPHDPELVGPNSVDLRLGNKLLVYETVTLGSPYYAVPVAPRFCEEPLDMKKDNPTREIEIPEKGYVLNPGILYLGRTIETIGSDKFVPIVEGRSSVGRLGIHVHVTAGFCDIGFKGTITLEIHCIHPVRIYPNLPICQAYFLTPAGEIELYKGRYQNQVEPTASRFSREKPNRTAAPSSPSFRTYSGPNSRPELHEPDECWDPSLSSGSRAELHEPDECWDVPDEG